LWLRYSAATMGGAFETVSVGWGSLRGSEGAAFFVFDGSLIKRVKVYREGSADP
jgi:hypothetical protein